jgi:hypothetical protein
MKMAETNKQLLLVGSIYFVITICYFCITMTPDYPHKIFTDKRTNFNLLKEVLSMDYFVVSINKKVSHTYSLVK